MTSVAFISSHVGRDVAAGRLTVWIGREDERAGRTVYDEIWFEVPADFRTHNDCVATALMTLVGRQFRSVTFNFPISAVCGRILAEHYALDAVGPIDSALEPRQPGRLLGLNFSGGLDSMAVWVLLKEHVQTEFRAIATAYGAPYDFEERGFHSVPADVICRTNFRALGYGRHGRFNAAAALLFADYLDLGSLTSGHTHNQNPYSVEHLFCDEQPHFRRQEPAYHAAGLTEAHLIRGLNSLGTMRIVFTLAPQLIEASFAASAPPGWENHITKGLALRWLYEQAGRDLPASVRDLTFPASPPRFGDRIGPEMRVLFIVKHYGIELARRVMSGLDEHDLSFVDDLSFAFLGNYNTNYVSLMPDELRNHLLSGFHACGIYPYSERDWREFNIATDFLLSIAADPGAREMDALRRRQKAEQRNAALASGGSRASSAEQSSAAIGPLQRML